MHPGHAWRRPSLARDSRREASPTARRLWGLALAALFAFALSLRVDVVARLEHPGHGDSAFYFSAARNLAERGRLEIDYVWHFLDPPEQLTHPAGDYWATFASVLMAVPMAAGGGLTAAAATAALFGLLTGLATLVAARAIGASAPVQLGACAVALLHPELLNASTSTDATIFYAAFVTATFALLARGAQRPAAYGGAALCAALAHATRQDGVLLLPALGLAVVLGPHARDVKERAVARTALVYLAGIAPFLLHRHVELGSAFPSNLSSVAFARDYEELFSAAEPRDWSAYRAWGWPAILASKRAALVASLRAVALVLGPGLLVALALGLARGLRRRAATRPVTVALLAFVGLQLVFYVLVATVVAGHGSVQRVSLAVLPALTLLGLHGLDGWCPRPWLSATLLLGLCGARIGDATVFARGKLRHTERLALITERLHVALERTLLPGDRAPVLMTRGPWELHLTRGHPTVQVPTDDLETIFRVADRYDVTHVVLPAPHTGLRVEVAERHPRLQRVAVVHGTRLRVYRLLDAAEPRALRPGSAQLRDPRPTRRGRSGPTLEHGRRTGKP